MFSVHLIRTMMYFYSLLEKWERSMIHALNSIQLYTSIWLRCRRHFMLIRSLANLNGRPAGNAVSSFLTIELIISSLRHKFVRCIVALLSYIYFITIVVILLILSVTNFIPFSIIRLQFFLLCLY